ncbi:hypothetical protein SAMN05216184_101254 [Georgenia satyanarayanai]|uniref:Uncharacterized protein n=1 Tax=Georgenia satyanarayanai TaxID=860221 RepID=A0A2Y8ZW48_9MICO|nr:hypothetical protein [Georgenia satyanarayanai]PYG01790.1 hypothetical protein A8987_101254 [Georgenia satyanarayanai]SSA36590.1 hypothetical protein SAMN05216184_101254 [Georgenia satyanarayanai]
MPKKKRSPRKPTGRRPERPAQPGAAVAGRDSDRLPLFFDQVPDEETMQAVLAAADEHALLVDAPLMRRADTLMRTVGSGHPYVLEEGRVATPGLVESTGWDAARVGAIVAGLVGGGFLERRDGQLVPAAGVAPWAWAQDPPEKRVVAGRILYATTLGAFFDDAGGASSSQTAPLTAMALMSAVAPGGVHLPEAADDTDALAQLLLAVRADLLALEDIGLVTRDGDAFVASPVLIPVLPAVVADMEARLA